MAVGFEALEVAESVLEVAGLVPATVAKVKVRVSMVVALAAVRTAAVLDLLANLDPYLTIDCSLQTVIYLTSSPALVHQTQWQLIN